MNIAPLSDEEFSRFRNLIYKIAGISLSAAKKPLVCGRLSKRLSERQVATYGDYFDLLSSGNEASELQLAVDLLTTNETYFFREPEHFDFLRQQLLPLHKQGRPFRVWSAACSSGQEPYTIAMMLAEHLGDDPWDVLASDISARVLERARSGHYPLEQAEHIPKRYLNKYCLKGVGPQEGTFLIDRRLRDRVNILSVNLNTALPSLGEFNLVFLRNVMIYFNQETKRQVTRRILEHLKPGGHLIVGHSESLHGIADDLKPLMPSIYRKP